MNKKNTSLIFFSLLFLFALLTSSNSPKLEYKYSAQAYDITCDEIDQKLLKEALYSFEDDIQNKYTPKYTNTFEAYRQYLFVGMSGKAPYSEIASEHSLQIMQELKKQDELWIHDLTAQKIRLNYRHPLIACLIENFTNEDLKMTIKALDENNALNTEILDSRMKSLVKVMQTDKYLATYVALDSYYGRLYDLKIEDLNKEN